MFYSKKDPDEISHRDSIKHISILEWEVDTEVECKVRIKGNILLLEFTGHPVHSDKEIEAFSTGDI